MWADDFSYLLQSGRVPDSVGDGFASEWRWAFAAYLNDGDPSTSWAYDAYARAVDAGDAHDQETLQGIAGSASQTEAPWDDVVLAAIEAYRAGEEIAGEGVARSVVDTIQPLAELWWEVFKGEAELLLAGGEQPEVEHEEDLADQLERLIGEVAEEVPVQPEHQAPDQPTIAFPLPDGHREWAMSQSADALKAAQEVGQTLPVWQLGDLLLIGSSWETDVAKDEYRRSALLHGGGQGMITVKSRGGITSRGEIAVAGNLDRAAFEESLEEFSKKKVSWV